MPLFLCHRLSSRGNFRRRSLTPAIAALVLFGAPLAFCSPSHRESIVLFQRAEKIQLHLEAQPLAARTRGDYEHALEAYRAVYHGDPASPDAGLSIAAVADLLAREGRLFHDAKLSRDAIAQWEFLRREYPQSPLRQRALSQQAEIERADLHGRAAPGKLSRKSALHPPQPSFASGAKAPRPRNNAAPQFQTSSHPTAVPMRHSAPAAIAPVALSGPVRSVTIADTRTAMIEAVRAWPEGNSTRLAIDMNRAVPYRAYLARNGKQVTVIFFGAHLSDSFANPPIPAAGGASLASIHATVLTGDQVELVLASTRPVNFSSFALSGPYRLIVDIAPANLDSTKPFLGPQAFPGTLLPVHSVPGMRPLDRGQPSLRAPPMYGQPMRDPPSMARVLGLRVRRIVIDAGHGGYDSGTLGPGGLEEKDIALDVALRLGRLLQQRLGAEVLYTRRSDIFVPLAQRTAIANRAHADLFLSIHANSSPDPGVRGVETYFLNFTRSPDALQVAARENAVSNRSVHELSDLVRRITLSDKIDESREFAGDVQQSLYSGLAPGNAGLKNRGVKQAPFAVLIGANMPSILAEISFLTNPKDANELVQPAYRERLAEALYRGVAQYVDGMSGVRIAKTAPPDSPAAPVE